jgi:hypothetical protein
VRGSAGAPGSPPLFRCSRETIRPHGVDATHKPSRSNSRVTVTRSSRSSGGRRSACTPLSVRLLRTVILALKHERHPRTGADRCSTTHAAGRAAPARMSHLRRPRWSADPSAGPG